MAKVQTIQKSRKEYKCSKCGKVIPVGSKYYKGEINFGPTIIRCADCGLQHWEVTTSDWRLCVGAIIYRWEEDFGINEETVDSIIAEIEDIKDDQEDRLYNMPEGLQDGDVGQLIQSRIDACEDCLCELYDIDIETIESDALAEFDVEDIYSDEEFNDVSNTLGTQQHQELMEIFQGMIRDAVESALNSLEV